jgi:hypothetical protein
MCIVFSFFVEETHLSLEGFDGPSQVVGLGNRKPHAESQLASLSGVQDIKKDPWS